MIKFI